MIQFFMILSVVVAGVGWARARSGACWARPLMIIGAITALVLSILQMLGVAGNGRGAQEDAILHAHEVAGQVLGQAVAETYPGAFVAILIRPLIHGERDLNSNEAARLRGLIAGLGKEVTVRRIPLIWTDTVRDIYPDPVSYQFELTGDVLRESINQLCPDAQVVILASEFPNAWTNPQFLQGPYKLMAFDIDPHLVDSLVRAGILDMAVVPRDEVQVGVPVSSEDPKAMFNHWYRLVIANH